MSDETVEPLTVLDLFSGIGGFSLGLERTGGFKTIAFCENNAFCRQVLKKHWPEVPCYEDVTTASFDRGFADVVCGGFPCQDISAAGRQVGITGKRSGLWSELCRIIGEVGPSIAIVENVSRLLSGGDGAWMGTVLGDLAEIGYDAEWHCIPASAVGAPHIRDRVWIIAYPQHSDADSERCYRARRDLRPTKPGHEQSRYAESLGALLAEATSKQDRRLQQRGIPTDAGTDVADASGAGLTNRKRRKAGTERDGLGTLNHTSGGSGRERGWRPEPNVGRVVTRLPAHVDRLRALGNAVVPKIPELIGNAILAAHAESAPQGIP